MLQPHGHARIVLIFLLWACHWVIICKWEMLWCHAFKTINGNGHGLECDHQNTLSFPKGSTQDIDLWRLHPGHWTPQKKCQTPPFTEKGLKAPPSSEGSTFYRENFKGSALYSANSENSIFYRKKSLKAPPLTMRTQKTPPPTERTHKAPPLLFFFLITDRKNSNLQICTVTGRLNFCMPLYGYKVQGGFYAQEWEEPKVHTDYWLRGISF